MSRIGEIAEGRIGVLIHACFGWMKIGAFAEASVVDGEDIDAERVQGLKLADRIG